jgi:hypothetical protein
MIRLVRVIMGISPFKGSVSTYDEPLSLQPQPPMPDPKNYKILKYLQYYKNLLVAVKYPDCTNYEGIKILLYKDTTIDILRAQGSIDPHFSENSIFESPIARFAPTKAGWDMAMEVLITHMGAAHYE